MRRQFSAMAITLTLALLIVGIPFAAFSADNSNPPSSPVKLIFIHHSTGGNWLADSNSDGPYGGLGIALRDNNYYVSATNYGWGPNGIGENTDIPHWPQWFTGSSSNTILNALYNETAQSFLEYGSWSRLSSDPGGENEIIMFKSCFPNSDLYGNPDDAPASVVNDWEYSVSNAKAVYNEILGYFETRQDKLFVAITAPPLMESETDASRAANARAFTNWLVNDWLDGYAHRNVAVFNYYNVLTDPDNHHRWNNSAVEHVTNTNSNFAYYPSDDSHPSSTGHLKATTEFVPLLNVFWHRWKDDDTGTTSSTTTTSATTTTGVSSTTTSSTSSSTTLTTTSTTNAGATTTTINGQSEIIGLIQPSDLEYKGTFRLPDADGDCDWTYSPHAMTYYPDGDSGGPDDGYPGSLFASGNDSNCQHISEISIPAPVISQAKNLDELNTAGTLQEFQDIRGGLFGEYQSLTIPRIGLEYLPAQGSQSSGKLHFCSAEHFQDEFVATHGWCELDLSNPQTAGAWKIGTYTNYTTDDYIFEIPKEWADANVSGQYLATGRFREGVWSGRGPALFAYGPWNKGNPPAPNTTLSATPLLLYGTQEAGNSYIVSDETTAMNDYAEADHWFGGAWLTAGSNAAVVFIGTKAVERTWYGYANGVVHEHDCYETETCPETPAWPYDDRGYWAEDFEARIIFYDPDDLADVATGRKQSWEPQPYASLNMNPHFFDDDIIEADDLGRYRRNLVGAAAFDRAQGLLYVSEKQVDEEKPLIHVWKINERAPDLSSADVDGNGKIDFADAISGLKEGNIKAVILTLRVLVGL